MAVGIIERAFQLASESHSLAELRSKLWKEGYSDIDDHLAGGGLRRDLAKLYKRGERPDRRD